MACTFFNFHVWKSLSLDSALFICFIFCVYFTHHENQKGDRREDEGPVAPACLLADGTTPSTPSTPSVDHGHFGGTGGESWRGRQAPLPAQGSPTTNLGCFSTCTAVPRKWEGPGSLISYSLLHSPCVPGQGTPRNKQFSRVSQM